MTTTTEQTATQGADLRLVDPATLLIDTNVRDSVHLDSGFVASIREHGVLVPIVAHQDPDGGLHVRYGQRRTLAAMQAGRTDVPVWVVTGEQVEADRIATQVIENDHRAALSTAQRVAAFEQMALLGVSAAQIAKRTGHHRKDIDAALTVAKSTAASTAAAEHGLTLDQAATIAEFDDDPDAVAALTATATDDPDGLAHHAQRLRDERTQAAAARQMVEDLTAQGLTVVDRPAWDAQTQPLGVLVDVVDGARVSIEVDAHATCPGHVAWVRSNYNGEPQTVYGCADPAGNGHTNWRSTSAAAASTGGPMNDEQKAERREVVANNKAWDSAQTVRRAWLGQFAARKSTPRDGAQFLAARLVDRAGALDPKHEVARTVLGLGEVPHYGQADPLAALIETASPARAAHLSLVLVLAAIEATTGRHTWRHGSAHAATYLRALASWGYGLSDVERLVTDPEQTSTTADEQEDEAGPGEDLDEEDDQDA